MVLEQELETLSARSLGGGRLGLDLHALADGRATSGHHSRGALAFGDLYLAHAAGTHRRQAGVIAVVRHIHAVREGCGDQGPVLVRIDFLAIEANASHARTS